jgi:hypothetical protein
MAIEKELLDQLLAGRDPNEVFAKDGLLDDLKKALSERLQFRATGPAAQLRQCLIRQSPDRPQRVICRNTLFQAHI